MRRGSRVVGWRGVLRLRLRGVRGSGVSEEVRLRGVRGRGVSEGVRLRGVRGSGVGEEVSGEGEGLGNVGDCAALREPGPA